jgi:hypothetical protein
MFKEAHIQVFEEPPGSRGFTTTNSTMLRLYQTSTTANIWENKTTTDLLYTALSLHQTSKLTPSQTATSAVRQHFTKPAFHQTSIPPN